MITSKRIVVGAVLAAALAAPIPALAATKSTAGNVHGPETVAQQPQGAAATTPGVTDAQMAAQIHRMQAFHKSLMEAKTPEARSKLMQEHMQIMQDSMAMMKAQPATGKGMGMGGCMHKHPEMKSRMEMMDMMLQLMQDQQTLKNP